MNPIWSYVLTIVGVTGMYLVGRKIWWAWWVGTGAQIIWMAYAVSTKQWGFIVSAVAYGWVQSRNAVKWTAEHRARGVRPCDSPKHVGPVTIHKGDLAYTYVECPHCESWPPMTELDEAEEKIAFLASGCLRMTRDDLIAKITQIGPERWKSGSWLDERLHRSFQKGAGSVKTRTIDIVFDGPPHATSGRFVETEQEGASLSVGEWIDRGEGLWALRIKQVIE